MTQRPKPCFPLISSWSFPSLVKWVYCPRDSFKPYIKSICIIYERVDVQYYLLRNDDHPLEDMNTILYTDNSFGK